MPALLLCIACVPAQSLAWAQQAWAAAEDGDFYFVLYESKEQKGFYDLVLQNTDEEDATYGTKVESCTYGEYSFILSSTKLWYGSSAEKADVIRVLMRDRIKSRDSLAHFFSRLQIL